MWKKHTQRGEEGVLQGATVRVVVIRGQKEDSVCVCVCVTRLGGIKGLVSHGYGTFLFGQSNKTHHKMKMVSISLHFHILNTGFHYFKVFFSTYMLYNVLFFV